MEHFPNKIKTFGSSMSPLLQDRDIVYLKRIPFKRIKINDIICARKNKKIFTHRVIYKSDKFLITKGDSNLVSDGKIYPKQIIGTIYQFKRNKDMFDIDNIYLFQSTLYLNEIVKVKKALEREKLEFLFLKGLPLHLYYEKRHPRRIYADCDVLIKKSGYNKCEQVLRKCGYKRQDKHLLKGTKNPARQEQEISFVKNSNGATIEFDVHLEVVFMMTRAGSFKMLYGRNLLKRLTNKFLDERIMAEAQNEVFPILSSENLFIYLALHLFHHNFEGSYRYDFYRIVIQKSKIDYEKIAKTIMRYKLENFIYPALSILKKYYKVKLPSSFIKSVKPARFVQGYTKNMKFSDIFDSKGRIGDGIKRFKNIFDFSMAPFYMKSLVFFDPQVLQAIVWIVIIRLGLRGFKITNPNKN